MFEKIVVCLDGSALSERVLGTIEPVVVRVNAELLLVRVVESPEAYDEALAHLRSLRESLEGRGIRTGAHVLVGADPAAEIVDFAANAGATLVAAGTHGRTGLARLALGSVAEQIVRSADRPVLLVNALVPTAPLGLERVLLPLDGSEASEKVFPLAQQLAHSFGSELVALAVEDREVLASPTTVADEHARTVRAFERARRVLEDVPLRTVVRVGFPSEEIVAAVADSRPDLVLMTTHGRTGLARVALGSVAEEVIRRSPVPVLVLH